MLEKSEQKTIVVKIGTDALLKKNNGNNVYKEPNIDIMKSLVRQLAELKTQGHTVILVSSGAVGFGRARKKKPASPDETIAEKQKYASLGQIYLMETYGKLLAEHSLLPAQCLIEKRNFSEGGKTLEIDSANSLDQILMDDELIPIINENDVTASYELHFSDNDELAGLLAAHYKADHLVLISSEEGVFTADPKKNPNARLIKNLNIANFRFIDTDGKSEGGTGGMKSKKIAGDLFFAAHPDGLLHVISPHSSDNFLLDVLDGKPIGTRITNGPTRPVALPSRPKFQPLQSLPTLVNAA